MDFERLHQRAIECVQQFKSAESELISILQQIDRGKGFRCLGYASLFEYSTKALGLSESHSYALITVCRKSNQVPQLKKAIEEGLINTSQARRITSVITPENQAEWIGKAASLNQKQLEREIIQSNPKEAVKEMIKPVSPQRMKLVCGIPEKLMQDIERVKDLESQKKRKAVTLEETLQELVSFYLERQDPVKKAQRALTKPTLSSPSRREDKQDHPRQTPIPTRIKQEVTTRDQGQCTAQTPDGKRCEQKRWIEIHHLHPVAQGGGHTTDNLATLCHHHHKLMHEPNRLSQPFSRRMEAPCK
ncbi:MAG: HNH endonuclease [Deltaproteobacteria bacterium]|nr:HNH endonuclease [Deltaproteobacteria bacterium]